MKNLAVSLIEHGEIKTTLTRSKALRKFIEPIITISKEDSVANRRLAFSKLSSRKAVKKLFEEVGPKVKERNGGYTRILKFADNRVGDNAPMSLIQFVD